MKIDKKKWFDVLDSKVERENGRGFYYNVEARFSDHPVINMEKSRVARHNVYDYAIVLHTRVKRAVGEAQAVKNMASHPIRFDKPKLSQEAFIEAVKLIARCYDAWEHYQQFREAPVTAGEEKALLMLEQLPSSAISTSKGQAGKVLVDVGGKLVERSLAGHEDDEEDEDSEPEEEEAAQKTARKPQKPRKPRRAA